MVTSIILVIAGMAAGVAAGLLMAAKKADRIREEKTEAEKQLSAKIAEAALMAEQLKEQKTSHEKDMREIEERHGRELNERMEKVKEQISTATNEMLKARSQELFTDNKQHMGEIVNPLKMMLDDVKRSIDTSKSSYDRNTAALEEQLKKMCEATLGVGAKADRLSEALQSGPKVQGNFGEMKLEVLLDKFGFTKGVEYDLQDVIRNEKGEPLKNDETGRIMIPDAILHYPDDKDVVIDSKVSLTDFVEYVNATSDDEKNNALQNHIRSIHRHVEELSRKEYQRYVAKNHTTLDYVIMFVPNESALVLALSADPMLWRNAFEKNVFITGEQNLFAVLQLLKIMWTQKRQSQNHEQVFEIANQVLERVGDFVGRYDDLGDKIKMLNTAYESVRTKVNGRQGIKVSAQKLVDMGARESARHPLGEIEEQP